MALFMRGSSGPQSPATPSVTPLTADTILEMALKQPGLHAWQAMTITPAMAAEMLKYNTGNRPISRTALGRVMKHMKAGEWHYTGEPIIFAGQWPECRLIDGQHRLLGSVETDASFVADVVFGRPVEAFAHIDQGLKRSPSHLFSISGIENAATMAGAMRIVLMLSRNVRSLGSQYDKDARATIRPSSAELLAEFKKHPGLPDSTWVGFKAGHRRMMPPSMAVALHYMCAKKSRADADYFFTAAIEGGEYRNGKNDVVYRLRNILEMNITDRSKRLTEPAMIGTIIHYWNAMRDGLTRPRAYRADSEFPAIR